MNETGVLTQIVSAYKKGETMKAGTIIFPHERFQVRVMTDAKPADKKFIVVAHQPTFRMSNQRYSLSDAITTAEWLNDSFRDGRLY